MIPRCGSLLPSVSADVHSSDDVIALEGRGGYIENVRLTRLVMKGDLAQPIFISMFYSDARNATNATATPRFANITLQDITVQSATPGKAGWAGSFIGLPESKIDGLTIKNVTVQSEHRGGTATATPAAPWLCSDVTRLDASAVTPPLGKCV